MKAVHYILLITIWLLSYPGISVAQRPFLFNPVPDPGPSTGVVVVEISTTDSTRITEESNHLIKILSSEGYFQATIDSIQVLNHESVKIHVTKGPRSVFNEVMDSNEYTFCESIKGHYFSNVELSGCMKSIVDSLTSSGYPFSTVSILEFIHDSKLGITTLLDINQGEHVFVTSSTFKGNTHLSEQTLLRLTGKEKPKLFSPAGIDEALIRLNQSEYISEANYAGLYRSDSTYYANFTIDEIRTNTVDLMLGLEPKVTSGYRLVGHGAVRLNHLFVPASHLHLKFHRTGLAESRLNVLYNQYEISRLPIGYNLGIDLRQIESSYLSVEPMVSTNWRFNSSRSLSIDLRYTQISNFNKDQLVVQQNQARIKLGIEYEYKSINNWRIPTSGSTLKLRAISGYATIQDDTEDENPLLGYSINQFEFYYVRYISLPYKIIIVPSLNISQSIQDIYFDFDLSRFGGTNTMRGFREDQFRLAGYSTASMESRRMLNQYSFLFVFFSGAYIWNPDELGNKNFRINYSSIYSGGFGLSYRVRPGILNVSYAISSDEVWLNGKIHIGITNSF